MDHTTLIAYVQLQPAATVNQGLNLLPLSPSLHTGSSLEGKDNFFKTVTFMWLLIWSMYLPPSLQTSQEDTVGLWRWQDLSSTHKNQHNKAGHSCSGCNPNAGEVKAGDSFGLAGQPIYLTLVNYKPMTMLEMKAG